MISLPGVVWRGGPVARGVAVGTGLGLFFGALAWLDAGMWFAGAVVFVVLGIGSGYWAARSTARYWPGARELTGEQREAVASAVRSGQRIGDADLHHAVRDYRDGLHAAAERNRPVRWLVIVLLAVAVAVAIVDVVSGTWGNIAVSVIYLVLIMVELFWVPRWMERLLANADSAVELAADPAPDPAVDPAADET